jgi:Tol biopolymer transport system component
VRADTGAIQPKGITRSGALYYKIEARSFRNVYRATLGEDGKIVGTPKVIGEQFVNANWGASLSPDGGELAFYSFRPRQTLVIRNAKTGKERVFPIDMGVISGRYFDGPQWFADGRSVLVTVSQPQHPGDISVRIDTASGKLDPYPIGDITDNAALYRISRDGKHVFYRGAGGLVSFDLESRQKTFLLPTASGTNDRIGSIAVSPDGKQVAYRTGVKGTHVFKIISVSGGEPREVFRFPAEGVGGLERFNALSWTPDQRHLLFLKTKEVGSDSSCSYDSRTCVQTIWRIDVAKREAERIGGDLRVNMKNPELHPDGRSIYFSGMGIDDELWVLENFLPTQTASK